MPLPTPESSRSTRPNILFFFADDQRNHTLGCAGHPIVKTPNIDRLAADGVRFKNAFVTTSTCWVSRACLFTGCYERRHLYRINPGPLDPDLCATSYFAVLKKAGYRTGHIGKEHVAIAGESAAAMFDVRRKIGRNPYFKKQEDGSQRHETQILGDWAIEFLHEQPRHQPFCLTVRMIPTSLSIFPHFPPGSRARRIGMISRHSVVADRGDSKWWPGRQNRRVAKATHDQQ